MTPAKHALATAAELEFMRAKGLFNGTATWKDVTPREMVDVFREGLRRAGAPDGLAEAYLNQINGWCYNRRNVWRCP